MNTIKIKGENFYENTTFEFTPSGMIIYVSLNVSSKIAKHLSPNNIFKDENL